MEVIGAGLGRTGTTSLAAALVQLGFGPCYSEEELHVDASFWRAVIDGAEVDWDEKLGSSAASSTGRAPCSGTASSLTSQRPAWC